MKKPTYIAEKVTTKWNYEIIATAARKNDGLYHIDNLSLNVYTIQFKSSTQAKHNNYALIFTFKFKSN